MTEAIKKVATSSWRTTLGGFLAMIVVLLQSGALPYLDGLDTTKPDLGLCLAAVLGFVSLWNARDHGVSSEQAGAKIAPKEPLQ